MKALISPNEQASYTSSWEIVDGVLTPVTTILGLRVAEVTESAFEVGEPLFWVDCAAEVNTFYFYDPETQQLLPIPEEAPLPDPSNSQPQTSGLDTL